jgi:tRNA(His) 5'-end guanylyltransferase
MNDNVKTIGEYQRLLERFENTNDQLLLPDLYFVIRVDAHRIGDNWSEISDYPFSETVVKALRETARNLMMSGFRINYSFVHGDEISLLLDPIEASNQRRRVRLTSLFASYATAYFNKLSAYQAVFHTKLSELPSKQHALDYFIWQRKVSTRNFLTRKIIQILQAQGLSPQEIDSRTSKLSEDERRKLLVSLGYPEEDLSISDLYGYGLWWAEHNSKKPQLVDSQSLGINEDQYLQLLNKVMNSTAPLFDEPENVSSRPSISASPVSTSQNSQTKSPSARKPIFRLDKK